MYSNALPGKFFGEVFEFLGSAWKGGKKQNVLKKRNLWNLIVDVETEQRDQNVQTTRRALNFPAWDLVMMYLVIDLSPM